MNNPGSRGPAKTGIGPAVAGQWLRNRSFRLAAGQAIAVAIPVAVLFYFQFRSLSDLGRSSAVVLRQLSQETIDTVSDDIDVALKAPHINLLLRITQAHTEPLDLPFVQRAFEDSIRRDPFITRYYVWSDATGVHRNQVLAYDRRSRAFEPNQPDALAVLERVRELWPRKRAIVAYPATIAGRRLYVQVQIRFTEPARDHLTSFVAFAVDADQLRRDYFPAFLKARIRARAGPTGFPPLVVAVADETGHVIFPADGAPHLKVIDERAFPLLFFDKELLAFAEPLETQRETWHLRTGYGTQTIPEIIEASERPQRAMMAVLAAVMALGVFFVVRAAAREVRLAELKSDFVSSVSHDLKTPLALIQLFAETLELGRLKNTERAHEYYRIINSEARKLTRLINNLLDFSRIEAGLRHYRREPVDLALLARRVLDALDSQFTHNQFSVSLKAEPGMKPVLIDPEAAEQALENVLSNAMKYSPEHRDILVEVDQADGFGRVHVTDRGLGIAPRLQRKIFRKFYRIQVDAGSGPQGTGLGLAIVDHVMRGQGGFVRVESEPGRGSTFTLHFPLFAGEATGDETDSGDRGRTADVARSA
jgi:signal transduction histidine kinase